MEDLEKDERNIPIFTALRWLSDKGMKIFKYILEENIRAKNRTPPSEDDLRTLGGMLRISRLYQFSASFHLSIVKKLPPPSGVKKYVFNWHTDRCVIWSSFRYFRVSMTYDEMRRMDRYLNIYDIHSLNTEVQKRNSMRDLLYVVGKYDFDLPRCVYCKISFPGSFLAGRFKISREQYINNISKYVKLLIDTLSRRSTIGFWNIDNIFPILDDPLKGRVEALLKIDYLPRELKMMIAMNLILYKIVSL